VIACAPPVRYLETRPSADLAPWVHCLWEIEGGGDSLAEPIFPDGRVEIVVHLGDHPTVMGAPSAQPDVMTAGQMTTALRLHPVARLHAVGVRFTPAGARAWLTLPLHEITDRVCALEDVSPRLARRVRDAAYAGRTPHERARRIERALRASLRTADVASRRVESAVRLTLVTCGRIGVDGLARACGISPRHLERQYLDAVGLTPKELARTVRFQMALAHLRRGVRPAEAAAACGFSDQSHLAREFNRFAGAPARAVALDRVAFLQDVPAANPAD
jgi:AraC-like DNA-binding protein